MGYWIIVILIILGGVLVLLAAASVETDGESLDSPAPGAHAESSPDSRKRRHPDLPLEVRVVVFVPRHWSSPGQSAFDLHTPGTTTVMHGVDGMTVAATAGAIDSAAMQLRDSVVTFFAGTGDLLSGHSLDSSLDGLDQVLADLSALPAMAVIASIPDMVPALMAIDVGVSDTSLSATIAIWNDAIADLATSYSAEFVDLSSVPVELRDPRGTTSDAALTVVPERADLTTALAPGIERAVGRVRSFRADT